MAISNFDSDSKRWLRPTLASALFSLFAIAVVLSFKLAVLSNVKLEQSDARWQAFIGVLIASPQIIIGSIALATALQRRKLHPAVSYYVIIAISVFCLLWLGEQAFNLLAFTGGTSLMRFGWLIGYPRVIAGAIFRALCLWLIALAIFSDRSAIARDDQASD